jgi:hypothetical protein
MATQDIQVIPKLDGNLFTGPTRIMSGVGRTLNPVLDTFYGEKMQWIYVGTTGNISYTKWDGTNQVLVGLQAGIWHHILSLRINSTGTTASNIVVGS